EKNDVDKKQSGKITFNSSRHSVSIFFASSKASLVLRRTDELLRYTLSNEEFNLSSIFRPNNPDKSIKWTNATNEEIFKIVSKKFLIKIVQNDVTIGTLRFISKQKSIFTINPDVTISPAILVGSLLPLLSKISL
ncbi:MAG: hypothetical protein ACTSQK_00390, partial [Candidatus Heimdallarchaeota archaeon]